MADLSKIKVPRTARQSLSMYIGKLLDFSQANSTDFRNRMEAIDIAYTRYEAAVKAGDRDGMDRYGNQPCNAGPINLVTPVVVSQSQSMVAYWSEVFLSGSPIFPVVSTADRKDQAEALEGIIQDHLLLSESIPELQLVLQDSARYNRAAVEVVWDPIKTYQPWMDIADVSEENREVGEKLIYVNRIKRLNLRNTHYDPRVPLHQVDSCGDYAGYSEPITRMKLKDLLNRLQIEKTLVNTQVINEALASSLEHLDYYEDPLLNSYVSNTSQGKGTNWEAYLGHEVPGQEGSQLKVPHNTTGTYILHTFYIRLIPSDFGIIAPSPNSVQVFRVRMVNRGPVISVEPYTGANGRFGIFIFPAIEDGLDTQTQSYAEMAMPIQKATTSLLNIRFADARRRIADRGIYNPDLLRPSDINSPYPEAKIPIKPNQLMDNALDQAYKQIPYDGRGTETVIQDAMLIQDMSRELSGMNNASRGQFQKGNKSVVEFDTIMGNSENRMRLPATVLEYRGFQKMKEQLKLNILMFGESTTIISPRNGKSLEVNIQELQRVQLQFEIADGYTPKSKLAGTDMLMGIINLIMNSTHLQQVYGSQLPAMVAHLAQLGGVRGMEQYATEAIKQWEASFGLQAQIQQLAAQLQQMQVDQQAQRTAQAQQGGQQ